MQNEQLKKHVAHQKPENDQLKSEVLNRKEDNVTLLNLAWQAKYALEDERAARKAGAKWKETFLHILFWNETFLRIPFWLMLSETNCCYAICLRDLILLFHSRW